MKINVIPKQPHPLVSYFRVGRLLYGALLLFILESWIYGIQLSNAVSSLSTIKIIFWASFFLFSFVHIYLVIMDGWSRYQNYKRAKDQFFEHGFHPKIAMLYMGSKCQRMAAETAAEELGIKQQVQDLYKECGVKWFHYIPYFMIQEPFFLFKKKFWSRTFLENHYKPKYNYHLLAETQSV
ncbi:hypothetical protein [Aequorivita flava]|uniref:Uncharacterized protein n=3 Tax=Aequorivita TaxID=153265 RepID=A0ABU9N940_9FLAO